MACFFHVILFTCNKYQLNTILILHCMVTDLGPQRDGKDDVDKALELENKEHGKKMLNSAHIAICFKGVCL